MGNGFRDLMGAGGKGSYYCRGTVALFELGSGLGMKSRNICERLMGGDSAIGQGR